MSQAKQEEVFRQLRQTFNPAFSNRQRLQLSAQVYDWLIRPIENDLKASQANTLIFVLDGPLRNLPMAALYDGKQYLIEKYQIALTSGLQLTATDSLGDKSLGAIAAGVSQSRQGFSALPGVEFELNQINSQLPSRNLLNEEFTKERLAKQIQLSSSPIIHLATHGQFSSDPEETFILTWDGQVNVRDFENLLKYRDEGNLNPIELLVLSACQTAMGDDRAALGLAGMAIKSGARSTIATLWSVKDESTALLMSEFYTALSNGDKNNPISKAEALRQSQIQLLKSEEFSHPFYWAPFTLIGNWL
ncbi:MAG: CHAT domain-containing protein [Synechococcaceae cyanobacterium RL_1_2]|nr:CHAT domain-containing protein [Synechococcaceae cyanobacterium RL_1_2]